jgi:hypothetical protein
MKALLDSIATTAIATMEIRPPPGSKQGFNTRRCRSEVEQMPVCR